MNDDWEPDWVLPRPGFVQIPEHARDEFHERVFQCLAEVHGWGHASRTLPPTPDRPVRVHELVGTTPTGVYRSRLWLAAVPGGLFAWTVGSGSPEESECDLWRHACQGAVTKFGHMNPVAWRAYLAQAPAAFPFVRARLAAPYDLADRCRLVPVSGLLFAEALTNVGQVMSSSHATALIQVDGETPCYAWHADGETLALRRLRLLSATLSLVWDAPWFLRDGPSVHIGASWAGASGPVSGSQYGWHAGDDHSLNPPPAQLPPWFADLDEQACSGAIEGAAPYRALLMHHEAVQLRQHHPSIALLAYVAAIETVAAAHEQLERCPQCKTFIGSTARFKRAIASVLNEADALVLGRAYDRRSRTIHDAQLHGRESIAGGWGTLSLYESDPAFTFEAGVLQGAHVASRALVWRELGALGSPPDAR